MQRDEIKNELLAKMPEANPEALETAISAILNLHHKEMTAAKKAATEAAEKASKADEIAAKAEGQATEITALQAQIEQLTARLTDASKKSNTANAIAKLVKAGMGEKLAASIAATSVTDDEKHSAAAIDVIIGAYAEQEQARAAEAAKNGMLNMPFPQSESGAAPSGAVDLAKKLAQNAAQRRSSGTLQEFAQK